VVQRRGLSGGAVCIWQLLPFRTHLAESPEPLSVLAGWIATGDAAFTVALMPACGA